MYPFPLSYATPKGPLPTGTVTTTVPPPESGAGAGDAAPSSDRFSPPLTSPRSPKGLVGIFTTWKPASMNNPATTRAGALLIAIDLHVPPRTKTPVVWMHQL